MAELFNVVFAGEIVGRAAPAVVRANVGKLFGASDAVLDKLFSGQPVAIKKMVDRATAMQLRARMKQAGAETRLVQVDISGLSMAAAGTEVLKEEERRQVTPVQVDLSGLSMAEVGAPLEELREHKPLMNPDTSYLKLAD